MIAPAEAKIGRGNNGVEDLPRELSGGFGADGKHSTLGKRVFGTTTTSGRART